MTLIAIGLMIAAALASWIFRGRRATALLLISVCALYALQPAGLDLALPIGTLLLVLGVWWLTTPAPTEADWRTLILLGIAAAVIPAFGILGGAKVDQALRVLPPMAALAVGTASVGALVPQEDTEARRRLAMAFTILIIGLLVILKLPALQNSVTGVIAQTSGQTISLDWQWLGFSYIAFRLMHVLLDYRSGRYKPVALQDFALYVIFFPAIPAGPIDRVERFSRDLNDSARSLTAERLLDGGTRIGIGLFKKFVLADTLAYIALSPRLVGQTVMPLSTWVMLYAYAFRIFFDFAGYSDIAIGIGKLAGIDLPENFTSPYAKRNITQFWNSWHITLSLWFRNYYFQTLSRSLMKSRIRAHKMLIILIAQVSTMVLIGLWHGIAPNFVLWGLWHGIGLWVHRRLTDQPLPWDEYVQARPRLERTVNVLSVLTTFHFVAIGWIFFALPDLPLIVKALAGLVGVRVAG